jgi:hypothetical protein
VPPRAHCQVLPRNSRAHGLLEATSRGANRYLACYPRRHGAHRRESCLQFDCAASSRTFELRGSYKLLG